VAEFLRIAWASPIYWTRSGLENFYRGMLDIGINAFLTQYHIEDWKTGEYKKYDLVFDVAAEYGIKVFWYTGLHRLHYVNPATGQYFVERYKNHPACGGWEWGDEPNYMSLAGGCNWEHAGMLDTINLGRAKDPNHPFFAVWGYDLSRCYSETYTPGCELFDVGCECLYPESLAGAGWENFLRYWLESGMKMPNNDGFAQCNKGMIPCIQAFIGGNKVMPKIVDVFNIWDEYYPVSTGKMKGIGFYRYGTFMGSGADKAAIREGIKEVSRLTGWSPAPPPPTVKTLTHACGAKIEYQVSSIEPENVSLSCPYDGLSLGVKGITGSVRITNIDEMATKLQGEIAVLNKRIADLQDQIGILTAEIAKTKETLGV